MSKKYNIIYADCPWQYSDKMVGHGMGAETHYTTQGNEWIKNMPIKDMTDKDCVLFLWAVSPLLPEALEVMEAWGFKFKTIAFNWVKNNTNGNFVHNMGRWTMGNCELCLLGTKGKPKRLRRDIKQLVISQRNKHSAKPNIIRKLIVDLMGDLPRLELFARGNKSKDLFGHNKYEGWSVFGNQVEDSITLPQ